MAINYAYAKPGPIAKPAPQPQLAAYYSPLATSYSSQYAYAPYASSAYVASPYVASPYSYSPYYSDYAYVY